MRYSGTWLTPQDEAILEDLRDHGPATPEELHDRGVIAYSRSYIEERCSQLAGRDRLVSFADGVYSLTDRGRAYLAGDLDPDELVVE